jgi:hypothetical protein
VISLSKLRREALTLPNLWDLFMVLLATLNLYLIVFDFAYFWIRPYAKAYVPAVVELYDPVKGVAPHPITQGLIEAAEDVESALQSGDEQALQAALERARQHSEWVVMEDTFAHSGQRREGVLFEMRVAREVLGEQGVNPETLRLSRRAEIARSFWTTDRDELRERLALFEEELRPLLAVNYSREYGRDGRPQDHFWKLDLPFLLVFVFEFFARWGLALKRREYKRWYLFPIFHWYDVLGMIPTKHMRIFRLFRIGSIYVRLRRSALSSVGDDILTRIGGYFYGIIAEEVSDMVALRILSETQEEVRDGTHARILATTLGPRKEEVQRVVANQVRHAVAHGEVQRKLRGLLRPAIERAAEEARSVNMIPLPASMVRPLFRQIGETVVEDFLHAVTATIDSDRGQEALEDIVGTLIDDLAADPVLSEAEDLSREVAVEILEEMKKSVRVKKWAQR